MLHSWATNFIPIASLDLDVHGKLLALSNRRCYYIRSEYPIGSGINCQSTSIKFVLIPTFVHGSHCLSQYKHDKCCKYTLSNSETIGHSEQRCPVNLLPSF